MLQYFTVTAFTVFELLRENQLGVKLPPSPPRLGLIIQYLNHWLIFKILCLFSLFLWSDIIMYGKGRKIHEVYNLFIGVGVLGQSVYNY